MQHNTGYFHTHFAKCKSNCQPGVQKSLPDPIRVQPMLGWAGKPPAHLSPGLEHSGPLATRLSAPDLGQFCRKWVMEHAGGKAAPNWVQDPIAPCMSPGASPQCTQDGTAGRPWPLNKQEHSGAKLQCQNRVKSSRFEEGGCT